jgi:uracil-DNA glycosylase family 4
MSRSRAPHVARLAGIAAEVTDCRACPRLVAWREQVARQRRAAYADQIYWARGVPGFGDPDAWLLVVGLAPGAHGSNRTGRMFTGDRSGEWLYGALHRFGLASQGVATARDDGLELRGVFVTAVVRCAPPGNKPTTDESQRCRPFLGRELDSLASVRVAVALGAFAYTRLVALLRDRGAELPSPLPRFGHGVEVTAGAITVLTSYHPSQQNTFTGKLTGAMFDHVWQRAVELGPKPAR